MTTTTSSHTLDAATVVAATANLVAENYVFPEVAQELAEQYWTPPHVPGARFGGSKPLYVLTSGTTFSGGEELAYELQQLGRAQIVGETTGGGAHPREGWTVHPHLEAAVPVARAVNPVSGTNWERVGVRPDVPCGAWDALDRALALALARLAEQDADAG